MNAEFIGVNYVTPLGPSDAYWIPTSLEYIPSDYSVSLQFGFRFGLYTSTCEKISFAARAWFKGERRLQTYINKEILL